MNDKLRSKRPGLIVTMIAFLLAPPILQHTLQDDQHILQDDRQVMAFSCGGESMVAAPVADQHRNLTAAIQEVTPQQLDWLTVNDDKSDQDVEALT